MADEQILRRLEALEVQKAADRQREELQAKLTAALERQSLRAELEKQALRAALENERRDRETDKKLMEERLRAELDKQALRAEQKHHLLEERMRVEERMKAFESQVKEMKAQAMMEQMRALQSDLARLQSQQHYSSADLQPRDPQPQRRPPQAQEQPAQQPPQTESSFQVLAGLQQARSASSEIDRRGSAAPMAQPPPLATASEESLSAAAPPPAVEAVVSSQPSAAEVEPTAPHQPASSQPRPQRGHAPTKSAAGAAVPAPENFDCHFFIRSVGQHGRADAPTTLIALPLCLCVCVFVSSHCQATGGDQVSRVAEHNSRCDSFLTRRIRLCAPWHPTKRLPNHPPVCQANAIYLELERMGFKAWYDNRADDLTKEGMLKGIEQAAAFILFLR